VKIKIHNLLYRCAKWFLTLKEEHRLRMSAKRVLGTTSGPNRMQEKKTDNKEKCG
jgi:hypothetical protein